MVSLIKVLLSYGVVIGPQLYAVLLAYQAQHPSPYLALLLAVLSGVGARTLHNIMPGS